MANKGKLLFDDDDEMEQDYGNSFAIKQQYEGEDGARLLKLQSKFKNDKRFDMNEKFLEQNENDDRIGGNETTNVEEDDERKWQYGILETVMGKKIQSDSFGDKRNK